MASSDVISRLLEDQSTALAELAAQEDWTRPVVDNSRMFHVETGRHPVVETALKREGATFIMEPQEITAEFGRRRIAFFVAPVDR